MEQQNDETVEVIGRGIYYGYCPKIGSRGLILREKHFTGDWKVNLRGLGLNPENLYWFQVQNDEGEWQSGHGMVNGQGTITQWG